MDLTLVALFLIVVLFIALGSGIWIALALFVPAYIGLEFFTSAPTGRVMATSIWGWTSQWTLASLPLFVWMGEILFRTRLSEDMFKGLAPWMNRLPGRLLHVNILACAIFAAASGSSAVTTATIGKMSLPELKAMGYPEDKSIGTLAGSGTLGFLIPPSILMIVYGATADVSVSRLFIAGIIPGLVVVVLFMGYIMIWSMLNPHRLPPATAAMPFLRKIHETRRLIPILLLIVAVIGSMYAGFATATEAAALGVVGALLVSFATGTLTRKTLVDSLLGATRTSCMIGFIVAGAGFLTIMMGYTKIPRELATMIDGLALSPYTLIFVLTIFYIILGCFLEGISIIVLSAAMILPMIERAGFDLVWFGIYLVFMVELALITPPVGFNLFVIQGLTGKNIVQVSRFAMPFFVLLLIGTAMIVVFPELATWLPRQMTRPN